MVYNPYDKEYAGKDKIDIINKQKESDYFTSTTQKLTNYQTSYSENQLYQNQLSYGRTLKSLGLQSSDFISALGKAGTIAYEPFRQRVYNADRQITFDTLNSLGNLYYNENSQYNQRVQNQENLWSKKETFVRNYNDYMRKKKKWGKIKLGVSILGSALAFTGIGAGVAGLINVGMNTGVNIAMTNDMANVSN